MSTLLATADSSLPDSDASSPQFHIAFYRFVALADPDAIAAQLRVLTQALLGNILVAPEGINGVLAGSAVALDQFQQALISEPVFEGLFVGINFKRSACRSAPFRRIKVHRKSEIVALGLMPGMVKTSLENSLENSLKSPAENSSENVSANTAKTPTGGINVSPADWRQLIAAPDVVLIDNRNSFEYRLGRFKSAIDPQVENFRDFPAYLVAHAAAWKAQGKRIAMYCTGGIRCEKTSASLVELGLDIYQLDGGILNYFQSMPDAEQDWEGECFVFDNRIALDTRLQETATTAEDVYRDEADGAWRLQRAKRLDAAN